MNKGMMALSVGVATALVMVGSPAQANVGGNNYRDCTRPEYRAVHRGDSLASVQRKLDGRGKLDFKSGGYQQRTWGVGYRNGWCLVSFQNKRVQSKSYVA